jgi:hypothetical protein
MPSFGFVGEGPTDYTVVTNIVAAYFGDDVFVRPEQPVPGARGGWPRVFTWLQERAHLNALQRYDYLIFHLDSDESNRYGVPHVDAGGNKLTPEAIVACVIERLVTDIGADFYAAHAHRFLFAIAVHEIECWLLVLHDDKHRHEGRIKNCLELANKELDRKRLPLLNKGGRGARVSDPYRRASLDFADRGRLDAAGDRNPSLDLFIQSLRCIWSSEALRATPPVGPTS